MPQTTTYDILMDGSCSFCRWTQAKVEPYDSGSRLRFLDYNDPAVAAQAPFSRDELDNEMHVRTPEGRGSRGSKHGWPCFASCRGSHGLDASPACRQCAGWAPRCTHLSRGTATASPGLPRAVRPIRARFRGGLSK